MKRFKTESKKLLDLMINSIYTNKEIFLRELISNASDALDKLSFAATANPSLDVDRSALAITLSFDKDARTIMVSDNGIGMTEDELDKNLGTIAHSGSEQFKAENAGEQGESLDIIGQFGVGFYSSFMVAGKVRVVSRALGAEQAYAWESDGVSGYTVSPAAEDERSGAGDHGTDVILTIRETPEGVEPGGDDDPSRFLSEYTLHDLVRRYSNYVRFPIKMMVTKQRALPKPEDAGDDYHTQYESYEELETLNSITPIWKKRSSDVEQSDYDEFYKLTFRDWDKPARTISFHAEGAINYDALLFIPSRVPFDLYSKDYEKGLALYSSNVMIQEKCADLVPDYYNFVRGVVDSPDVSLNISRETLQQNSQLRAIARRVEKKIKQDLESMRDNDREAYEKFFENFGRGIKFGIYGSYGAKAGELADLLLFYSAREERMVTLREYVDGMGTDQRQIYYAPGDSRDRLGKMPVVKSAIDHGCDVLLCSQDIDDFLLQTMRSYHIDAIAGVDGAPDVEARDLEFANVSGGDMDFATEDEKKAAKDAAEANEDLLGAMKEALDGAVDEVTISSKLTDAPASVSAKGPVSLEMERVMDLEGVGANGGPKAQRVLELNANHPVFAKLADAHASGESEKLKLYSKLLYDQALLVAGMPVNDPIEFAKNVCELM